MAEIFDVTREPFSLADLARYQRARRSLRDDDDDLDLLTSLALADTSDVRPPEPPDLSRLNLAQYAPDPIGDLVRAFFGLLGRKRESAGLPVLGQPIAAPFARSAAVEPAYQLYRSGERAAY